MRDSFFGAGTSPNVGAPSVAVFFSDVNRWPRGPMDKASAYGVGDCRFESCRGHFICTALRGEDAGGMPFGRCRRLREWATSI